MRFERADPRAVFERHLTARPIAPLPCQTIVPSATFDSTPADAGECPRQPKSHEAIREPQVHRDFVRISAVPNLKKQRYCGDGDNKSGRYPDVSA